MYVAAYTGVAVERDAPLRRTYIDPAAGQVRVEQRAIDAHSTVR
jgi:hypothetical protein